ncbi:MAG: hypothetical protein EA403_09070 [Spirochaetaceae bacterium]|nr:MAG: hypothetical protein EA403_09070 [Spirochaetaceae bacterium]
MNETLIVVVIFSALAVGLVVLGVQTAIRIWGRLTWWNFPLGLVLGGFLFVIRAVFRKDIGGTRGAATAMPRERMPIRISRATGPTEFTWDGRYVRSANGQILYEYSKNMLRTPGGVALYTMVGTQVRDATNGRTALETAHGKIKRPGGPTEWVFDGKNLKNFGRSTVWKASSRVPVMVMVKVTGVI